MGLSYGGRTTPDFSTSCDFCQLLIVRELHKIKKIPVDED
jgi:hypothetical protein